MLTKEAANYIVTEVEPHRFSVEASSLSVFIADFKPGRAWPRQINTTMGNGQPFVGVSRKVEDGDLIYARYVQTNGCITLKVYND